MRLLNCDFSPTQEMLCHGLNSPCRIPLKFLITAFIQGLSFGIVQAILLLREEEQPAAILLTVSFTLSAVILFVCVLFFKMDFNQLIYQVGFFIMAVGYLILAVVNPAASSGLFIHAIGYRFVDIMMWGLCAFLISRRDLPTNWVFAITTCFLLLGQLSGAFIGSAIVAVLPVTIYIARDIAAIMVFILLASSLIMSDHKNLHTGWGMVRPGDIEKSPNNFKQSCESISRRFGLTAREQEIFLQLAYGASRSDMCDRFVLSKETIKTHIRNIYRKMDIHSRQDVSLLVIAEQKALEMENGKKIAEPYLESED